MTTATTARVRATSQRRSPDKPMTLVVHHRRRVSTRTLVAVSVIAFIGTLFGAVVVQSLRAESDRSMDQIDARIRVEAERYLELRAELAEQEAPARIMEQARTLGMIDPGPVAPIASPEDQVTVERGVNGAPGA